LARFACSGLGGAPIHFFPKLVFLNSSKLGQWRQIVYFFPAARRVLLFRNKCKSHHRHPHEMSAAFSIILVRAIPRKELLLDFLIYTAVKAIPVIALFVVAVKSCESRHFIAAPFFSTSCATQRFISP
jgi:hypothetical protein